MKNDGLTPQGDSNTMPDPNIDTTPSLNLSPNGAAEADTKASANTPDDKDVAPASPQTKPHSPARLWANRENAKKSTGPRTARGKAYSSRNATKHGLLSKPVLYGADGKPVNDELHALQERLQGKYGTGDVRADLLMETVVVECWRQWKALDIEAKCFTNANQFSSMGLMPNLQRYRSASQRALEKSLELLEEQLASPSAGNEDEAEAEADASTSKPEDLPRRPRSGSESKAMAGEATMPEADSAAASDAVSGGEPTTGDVVKAAA